MKEKRYYRGTWISPDSDTAKALDAGKKAEADKHFEAAEAEYRKYHNAEALVPKSGTKETK